MAEGDNLSRLRAAYQRWHDTKAADSSVWLALLADQVDFRSCGSPGEAALAFATNRCSRQEVVAYFTGLNEHWTMQHFTPHTFVDGGDTIAMFGRCSYASKSTGKVFDIDVAHLWQLQAGRVTKVTEIFDSARVVAAAQP